MRQLQSQSYQEDLRVVQERMQRNSSFWNEMVRLFTIRYTLFLSQTYHLAPSTREIYCKNTRIGGCKEYQRLAINWIRDVNNTEACEELCRLHDECASYNHRAIKKTCGLFKKGCNSTRHSGMKWFDCLLSGIHYF